MLRTALLLPLLMVGVVSFVFIRSQAGGGGTLAFEQQRARPLTATAVARVVETAPDPVAEPTHAKGSAAACVPLGKDELRNPWRCLIDYRSGRRIQYLVTISVDGSYTGDHEFVRYRGRSYRDTGAISGCCIDVP